MKPTWAGWPEVLAAQKIDVESTAPCLYIGHWNTDSRDWIPEIENTGLKWDTCVPEVDADAELIMTDKIEAEEYDLWRPVGEESTIWHTVPYPR